MNVTTTTAMATLEPRREIRAQGVLSVLLLGSLWMFGGFWFGENEFANDVSFNTSVEPARKVERLLARDGYDVRSCLADAPVAFGYEAMTLVGSKIHATWVVRETADGGETRAEPMPSTFALRLSDGLLMREVALGVHLGEPYARDVSACTAPVMPALPGVAADFQQLSSVYSAYTSDGRHRVEWAILREPKRLRVFQRTSWSAAESPCSGWGVLANVIVPVESSFEESLAFEGRAEKTLFGCDQLVQGGPPSPPTFIEERCGNFPIRRRSSAELKLP